MAGRPIINLHRYYVCGYTWALFWTYFWFGALVSSSGAAAESAGPSGLFLLDCARAVLFTLAFAALATRGLPFKPSDLAPSTNNSSARLRLLVFRSTAVIVAVAMADLPTSFVTSFCASPAVLDLGPRRQLVSLFAVAAVAIVALTHAEDRCAR